MAIGLYHRRIFMLELLSLRGFSATPKALTLALSRWEREPEGWIGSPRSLGEGLGVRAYNFCQSTSTLIHLSLSNLPPGIAFLVHS